MSTVQSLIHGGRAVVRLREPVKTRRRLMLPHGQHGGLVSLPAAFALELVEAGAAKVPSASSTGALRLAVHELRAAAEAA